MVNTCDNVKIWRQQQVVNVKSEDRKVNVTKHRTSRSLLSLRYALAVALARCDKRDNA